MTALNLERNLLKDEGVTAICEALKTNTALVHLNIRGNGITPAGARSLTSMLEVNSALTVLDLRYNDLDNAAKNAIHAAWNGRSNDLKL